ncbi:MAG: hypothetical protein Q8O03_01680 [Nanoarchaeota archaeon]|nr:hypothetical protein [Nanoarchaeota archaeon]
MAKEEVVDTEREIYTQRKWHGRRNTFVSVILIIVLVTLGFYGFSWASSDIGRQKLSSFWSSVSTTYNPFYFYGEQLKGAQSFGNIWSTSSNATAEKIGIKFQTFESVGGKIIPSGAPLALKYKLDVGEGVTDVPLKLQCDIKEDKDKEYTTEDALIEQGSKTFLPLTEPKISTENPLSYSTILCQVNTKPQSADKMITARGIVKFPFKQRNSLIVYFTKDTVNVGNKFFEKAGLKEKLPILSKYSNEPVELGIGVSDENTQPVIVGENQYPAVGISLKNRWDGRVTKINTMDLMLPEGVKVNKERNKNPNILCPFDEGTSTGKYTKYSAKTDYLSQILEFGKGTEQTLETYQRFFCWLEITDTILGGKPYNDKEYHVDVSYDYEFSPKTAIITLKKSISGGETTTPTETTEVKYYLCKEKTTGQYNCMVSCASSCEKCDPYNTQQECENNKQIFQGTI